MFGSSTAEGKGRGNQKNKVHKEYGISEPRRKPRRMNAFLTKTPRDDYSSSADLPKSIPSSRVFSIPLSRLEAKGKGLNILKSVFRAN